MISTARLSKHVAHGLMKHAVRVSPKERAEWAQAMATELEYLPPDLQAVRWALGCIVASYLERMNVMLRSLAALPRSVLAMEMLICFLPLTLVFSTVINAATHGGYTSQAAFMLYFSGSLLGPLGLAAAFHSIFLTPGRMSRTVIVGLGLLTVWTLGAYTSQLVNFGQSRLADWWHEFVIIAVLPALAVLHLASINFNRLVLSPDPRV
jgi:hypothetical protein